MEVERRDEGPVEVEQITQKLADLQRDSIYDGSFVAPGDQVDTFGEEGFLRGHGTQVIEEGGERKLYATLAGVVERVDKLISVRPQHARFNPENGDLVVGRITEIAGDKWKVDIGARQEATLQLSAVNLPGGVVRRRNDEDVLNMRLLYEEGDAISAEVQSFYSDGTAALHTRSLKYGKLAGGQLVGVSALLIKRYKHHFHHIEELDIDLILGCNGYVWVGGHTYVKEIEGESTRLIPRIDLETRKNICRIANAVRLLARLLLPICKERILDVYRISIDSGVSIQGILEDPFALTILDREAQKRGLTV